MPEPTDPPRRDTTRTVIARAAVEDADRRRMDRWRLYLALAASVVVVLGAGYTAWGKLQQAGSAEDVRMNAKEIQATRESVAELKGALGAQGVKIERLLIAQGASDATQRQMASDVAEIKQMFRDLAKAK